MWYCGVPTVVTVTEGTEEYFAELCGTVGCRGHQWVLIASVFGHVHIFVPFAQPWSASYGSIPPAFVICQGPSADVAGASRVPAQMWHRRAEPLGRCGRSEPSPGADAERGEPIPGADTERGEPSPLVQMWEA